MRIFEFFIGVLYLLGLVMVVIAPNPVTITCVGANTMFIALYWALVYS